MSKPYSFFKTVVRDVLEDDAFLTLWELIESVFQNYWVTIIFAIFLGIIFEVIFIKIYACFQKKIALPEKCGFYTQKVRRDD